MRLASVMVFLALATSASAQAPAVVRSSGPGAWGLSTRLVEEVRIGELEGSEEYTLGQIVQVVAGRDGAVFIAEANPYAVRMFDANGKFVRKIGGIGAGPGEFRSVAALAIMHDGSLVVRDGNLGRTNIYDAKGNFLRSHNFMTGFFTTDMFRVDQAGNFLPQGVRERLRPGRHTRPRASLDQGQRQRRGAG